jgi:hypothetical protein
MSPAAFLIFARALGRALRGWAWAGPFDAVLQGRYPPGFHPSPKVLVVGCGCAQERCRGLAGLVGLGWQEPARMLVGEADRPCRWVR